MHHNCIRYRDVMVAPGSKMHDALTNKDMKAAERIYQECEREARELVKPKVIIPGTLRGPCAYALATGKPTR